MNDDGSGQRPLLTAAQAGGQIGLDAAGDTGVTVEPNGDAIAVDIRVPARGGGCVQNCPGLYSLLDGRLVRLSSPSARCPSSSPCASEQVNPAITADGRVVFLSLARMSPPNCGGVYCVNNGGYIEQYFTRALDGHDAPSLWPLPAPSAGDPFGAEPDFHGALAADPADATRIAYTGNYVQGLDILHNGACGPQGLSDCFPLDVQSSTGAINQVRIDDSFLFGLSFSPDGTLLAGLETGDNKGIWVYPAGQSYVATSPPPSYTYALADPTAGEPGAGPFTLEFSGLAFAGSALVFGADSNLWTLPGRCWAAPALAPACSFPADAIQLTHDGTAETPNQEPAWTSVTTPIPADTSPPAVVPPPVVPLAGVVVSPRSVRSGTPLSIVVTLRAAAKINLTVARHVPASGRGSRRVRAHKVIVGRLTQPGRTGTNPVKLVRLAGHTLIPGRYTTRVSVGGRSRTVNFSVRG
jgi:hypothetical protein